MSKPTETEKLLAEVEAFLERTGMAVSTFGHYTVNDGKLVPRLREGGTLKLDTAAKVRRFIANPAKFLEAKAAAELEAESDEEGIKGPRRPKKVPDQAAA